MRKKKKLRRMSLSVRAKNALREQGFETETQCMRLSRRELLSIPNLGVKTVNEIIDYFNYFKLNQRNFALEGNGLTNQEKKERLEYLTYVLCIPLLDIPLSARARNILEKLGSSFLFDLVCLSEELIASEKNSGTRTLLEISNLLVKIDLSLNMRLPIGWKSEIDKKIKGSSKPGVAISNLRIKYPGTLRIINEAAGSALSPDRITFYKKCFDLYNEGGTLEYVGKIVKLSRQRIRQILVKGTKYKLFKYRGNEYPYISKQKLLKDFYRLKALSKVAKANNVSSNYVKRLLIVHQIKNEDIELLLLSRKKRDIIKAYLKIKDEIGYNPNTAVLQSNRKWRYLEASIRRCWGSIDSFRKELNIPASPTFIESVRPWIEHRSRIACIKRMQDLDCIRDVLTEFGSLQTRELATHARLNPGRAYVLIKLLMATGEVIREGEGSQTRYRIIKGGCKI
ncbi:MAG: hypothetical protein GY858_09465 [Candidatus Omnitrophica bacterium]|nr:hypothetical protein [Candidatus Omnitrophota bacterium]